MGDIAPRPDQNCAPATGQQDFETSDLYLNVYNYVEKYMSRYDMSHDFCHIQRVLGLSKFILAEELKADSSKLFNSQAVVLAALLHDVGDKKYLEPGENAEILVSDILSRNGCDSKLATKVSTVVGNVSYSNEIKRPSVVKDTIATHPELAIVQDADRIDAIGAIGIGRVFAFGAAKAADRGMQGSIDHFTDKLERLESMMKTSTGKRLARERTERLKQFRRWWQEESSFSA